MKLGDLVRARKRTSIHDEYGDVPGVVVEMCDTGRGTVFVRIVIGGNTHWTRESSLELVDEAR